jgi:cytochrome c oxidase subunit 1
MTNSITNRLANLPTADRRLLITAAVTALTALALGLLGGLMTALVRGGLMEAEAAAGYRFLTVHGVAAFFYWLSLAQTALLLGFTAAEKGHGLAWRKGAYAGVLLIGLGLIMSLAGAHMGAPLLYDGSPALAAEAPDALVIFNLGYLLLGVGLIAAPAAAIATLLRREPGEPTAPMSAIAFALFAWAGFLMVSGFAALHAFVPSTLWALGLGDFPAAQTTNWHILFHNMHYLPLMATVLMWYVLVRALTGVKSVFGERFSKIVFALYLVFVPPTSLYHMFLEPNLPGPVRIVGSLLSLFVSVPTLTAFLIIVASLELHARAQGARGLFGWLRLLPWRHPSMTAIGLAVANMGMGMALAFVLIQEKLAPLLSDTFFVPGYFHFFTVGTVSLTLLAGLATLLSALTGRALPRPALLRWMPWLASAGLLLFGGAGTVAGYLGVPRRVMDVSYAGEAPSLWPTLMAMVGVGGVIMAVALFAFAAGIALSLWPWQRAAIKPHEFAVRWGGVALKPGASAWVGPLSVLAIVGGMYLFTIIGFELLQAIPLAATGGAGH